MENPVLIIDRAQECLVRHLPEKLCIGDLTLKMPGSLKIPCMCHIQGQALFSDFLTLKVKALRSFRHLGTKHLTQCHITVELNLHQHHSENLKPDTCNIVTSAFIKYQTLSHVFTLCV
jgi:hypothetical protein